MPRRVTAATTPESSRFMTSCSSCRAEVRATAGRRRANVGLLRRSEIAATGQSALMRQNWDNWQLTSWTKIADAADGSRPADVIQPNIAHRTRVMPPRRWNRFRRRPLQRSDREAQPKVHCGCIIADAARRQGFPDGLRSNAALFLLPPPFDRPVER